MPKIEPEPKPEPPQPPSQAVTYHRYLRDWELAEKLYIQRSLTAEQVQAVLLELGVSQNSALSTLVMQLAFRASVLDEIERESPYYLKKHTAAVLAGENAKAGEEKKPQPPPAPEEEEESDVYPQRRR